MRISDWSSDVCSSDLRQAFPRNAGVSRRADATARPQPRQCDARPRGTCKKGRDGASLVLRPRRLLRNPQGEAARKGADRFRHLDRSEEHTSELQSLMRISYAVFCLKKKKQLINNTKNQ